MATPTIEQLRESLPNFPEEVLSDWLLPYAQSEGWPPAPDPMSPPQGRWLYLLKAQPLSYWWRLRWQQAIRHVSVHELCGEHQHVMVDMAMAAVTGQHNRFSAAIPNLKQRFQSVVDYIALHGRLPRPPALCVEPDGLSVLDGNHRMAAYFYCYGYFTNLDPGAELQLKTEEAQQYWIGSLTSRLSGPA